MAAVQFPAGLDAGLQLYPIFPVSKTKRRQDGVWQRCCGRAVILLRSYHADHACEMATGAHSSFQNFKHIFTPSSLDTAPFMHLQDN